MAHDHGNMNMDDEMGDMCPMDMSFHGGACEMILFKSWQANTMLKFVMTTFAIFIVAILYEGLKYFREILFAKSQQRTQVIMKNMNGNGSGTTALTERTVKLSMREHLLSGHHIVQSILHLLQVTVSYALMLIVMSFNVWLFIAVIVGAAVGYYFFGWIRHRSNDVTEHCH
ncbi:unnamed protein product [Diamesa serratosioi]